MAQLVVAVVHHRRLRLDASHRPRLAGRQNPEPMRRQAPIAAVTVRLMGEATHKMNHQLLSNRIPSLGQKKNLPLQRRAGY